ncbi:histone-lysine N-methyltransferase ATX2-like protein isoform X1 [Tanacetum coccineum]
MFPPSTSYYHVRGIKWQLHFLLCCSKVNDHFIFCKGSINLEEVCRNKKRVILIWTKWLADDLDVNEIIVLTANLDCCNDIEPGDIIWAKLTGHAVWPAIVRYESFVSIRRGLSKISGEKSVLLRNGVGTDLEGDGKKDEGSGNLKKMCLSTELIETKFKGTNSGPFIVGDLEVLKLDPSVCSVYKMEVWRDTSKQTWPLFRVTTNNGDQGISNSKLTSKSTRHMPAGFRPVHVKWKDLDKCNVCHMDEHRGSYSENIPEVQIYSNSTGYGDELLWQLAGFIMQQLGRQAPRDPASLGDALRPAHGWLCKSKGSFVPISSMCKDKLENTAFGSRLVATAEDAKLVKYGLLVKKQMEIESWLIQKSGR